ncbi:DUF5819 family protein [Streptomyces sp. NPDC055078]
MDSYDEDGVEDTGNVRSDAVAERPPHPPEQRKSEPVPAQRPTGADVAGGAGPADTAEAHSESRDPRAPRDPRALRGPSDPDVSNGLNDRNGPMDTSEPGDPADPAGPADPALSPGRGIMALSRPYRIAGAGALAFVALVTSVHLAMVFLHVAPSNTLTKQYGEAVDAWIYPEFEQNWKLFAPNPLQQNVSVQVKAEIKAPDGGRNTTGWIDLTAEDGEAIRGNLLPSHTEQNELRRAWDFYTNSHDDQNRATGLRGHLSEVYLRRIAMLRLGTRDLGGSVDRIQFRSETRAVKAPPWSEEKIDTRSYYRVLPWWTITPADLPGGVRNGRTERTERTEAGE